MPDSPATPTSPKVFISYSWSSPAQEQRVLDLAKRLMADGVHVIIDKWDLQEGQDLHAFMERMVNDETVTHVVVVSDRAYAEKADKREKGVGKEALIISAEVYAKAEQTKFLPVVFEMADGHPCLPTFMKGRIYIDMSTPEREVENYEGLVRRLYGKPFHQRPTLGKPPAFLAEPVTVSLPTSAKAQTARAAVFEQKPFADAAIEDYFTVLAEALEAFRVDTTAGADPFDDRVMASIASFMPYRDEFVGFVEFVARYRDIDQTHDTVHAFFETVSRYLHPPKGVTRWNERWRDNYKFIIGELFIHAIATLIKYRRFAAAHVLLGRDYRVVSDHGDRWQSFPVFSAGSASLDEDRNQRLDLRKVSVTADTLKSRATGKPVTFDDIMETELVLFLVSLMDSERTYRIWMPYTLLYRQHSQPLDFFARAESKKCFSQLKVLFGVESKDQLVRRIKEAGEARGWRGTIFFPNALGTIDYAELANLSKLDTRP